VNHLVRFLVAFALFMLWYWLLGVCEHDADFFMCVWSAAVGGAVVSIVAAAFALKVKN
jgi:hypothetical protein